MEVGDVLGRARFIGSESAASFGSGTSWTRPHRAEAKSTARDARSGPSAADVARLGGAAAVGTASVSPAPTSVTHPSGGPAPFRAAGRAAGRHGRGAPGAGTQDPGGARVIAERPP